MNAEAIVNELFEDIDSSILLGSAMYCLSDAQLKALKKRWIAIIQQMDSIK